MKRRLSPLLAIAILAGTFAYVLREPEPAAAPTQTPEEHALQMQCDARHGTLAVAHGERMWIECYQGRKKIWGVKL